MSKEITDRFERYDSVKEQHLWTSVKAIGVARHESFQKLTDIRDSPSSISGSISDVMKYVREVLELDYQDNEKEFKESPISFEYEIHKVDDRQPSLEVLTRLFNPEEDSSIYYGLLVLRKSEKEYVVWKE